MAAVGAGKDDSSGLVFLGQGWLLGVQGGFHALGIGGAKATAEGQCLVEVCDAVVGLSLVGVAESEAFPCAGLLQGYLQASGHVGGLLMVGTGLGQCRGAEQQLAQIYSASPLHCRAVAEVAK